VSYQTNIRKRVIQKINICLLAGVLVWILVLLRGAYTLRNTPVNHEYVVRFGPLILNHLTKRAVPGGFVAGFSFENGFLWYVLGWLLLGVAIGIGWSRHKKVLMDQQRKE